MPSIGPMELVIVLAIALLVVGPKKLPELGRSLGKSLAEFKRASNELRSTLEEEIRLEDQKTRVEPPRTETAPGPVQTHTEEPVVAAGPAGKVDKSA